MANHLTNKYLKTGFLFGALAVVFGAFGAHYIGDRIPDSSLTAYKTAVLYQFLHALLIIIIGFNLKYIKFKNAEIIYWLLTGGILFFSGSIYLLATRSLTGIESLSFILGPLTPIGGLLLIISWLSLTFSIQLDKKE